MDAACIFSETGLSEGRHRIDITVPAGGTLKLNPYIDLDLTNSAVLLKADIPETSMYTNLFDQQDTFLPLPSTYTTISKSSTLFDISTQTIDTLYDKKGAPALYMIDGNDADSADDSYRNMILLSTISDSAFVIADNSIRVLKYHFEYNVTIPKDSTAGYTSPIISGLISYSIRLVTQSENSYYYTYPNSSTSKYGFSLNTNNTFTISPTNTTNDTTYHIIIDK